MAQMKNEMSGKKGAPTAAELAEIRKELMSSGTVVRADRLREGKERDRQQAAERCVTPRCQFQGRRPEDDRPGDVCLRPRLEARADLHAQLRAAVLAGRTRPKRRSRTFRSSMKARPSSSPCRSRTPAADAPGSRRHCRRRDDEADGSPIQRSARRGQDHGAVRGPRAQRAPQDRQHPHLGI